MLKKILHTALLLCLAVVAQAQNPYVPGNLQGGPPVPGTRTRSPLNSMERAANNLAGATILTDTFGNQRLALFVRVEDTCIAYTPSTTGNTQNLSAFVQKCSTDSVWYIDWTGRSIFLGSAGAVCDEDWLRISDNACPDSITDSIYHYRYAAIGARLVWPTAEFLVSDSTGAAIQILSGNRNARLGFWDQFNQVYSTIDQSGTSTIWYINPTGEYRITTAGGGTPQSPGAPFVNQFGIDPNDTPLPTIQAYQYPNTRIDTNTVRNFVYTDNLGKLRTQPLDSLIVIIVDSIAADTSLQYNWYTRDATTTDALRTATILGSAQWLGDAPDGSIYFEMGSLGGGRALIDTAAAIYHSGLGGLNIVQTDAQGIDIATSNTASRAVNLTTDTMNMVSSFDPALMRVNLLSDGTYFFADSSKTVAIGQFPGFPSVNFDGTEKGFYYLPIENVVALYNGDGVLGTYSEFTAFALGTTAGTNDVNGNVAEMNTRLQSSSPEVGASVRSTSAPFFDGNIRFVQKIDIADEYSAHIYSFDGISKATIYLGQSTGDTSAYFDNAAAGIRTFGEDYSFDWIQVIFPAVLDDTTENIVSFYNRSYYFANDRPSPTLGDTSFHYWAGNGTTTNPGFITLAQVQAGVPNWYNSNGTTTDNTRIATVTETATWLSADVTADGVYPFRFQLAGVSPNEPEMMVWDFPAGDSLTLSQSDQEIVFFSNNFLVSRTNEAYTVQADSFQYNPNLGGTAFKVGRHNVVTQNAETGTPTHRDAIEYRTITGTAQTELFLDGSSAVWVVPTNAATNFKIHVSAICSDAGNGVGISTGDSWASWHLGGIKRVGSTTSLVGTVQTPATAQSDAGMSTSVVTIDADDTDESLRVRFTPPSTAGSTTVIRVIATLEITQTSY